MNSILNDQGSELIRYFNKYKICKFLGRSTLVKILGLMGILLNFINTTKILKKIILLRPLINYIFMPFCWLIRLEPSLSSSLNI